MSKACFLLCSVIALPGLANGVVDNITVDPSARWRFQNVNDSLQGDAQAHTLMLRLTATSNVTPSLTGMIQTDYVYAFNRGNYSDGVVRRDAAFIPDPQGVDLNQLWLSYQLHWGADITLGRQQLSVDNERHLGGNSFWQNEQTFDALLYKQSWLNGLKIRYTYINQVNRIFGRDADAQLQTDDIRFDDFSTRPAIEQGVHKHNSHLFDVAFEINNSLKIAGFLYSLDNQTFNGFSSHTLGVVATGRLKPDTIRYDYRVETAIQTDAYDSSWDYQATYIAINVSAQHKSHRFELGYENIGQDNGFGFVHSLGSNHQFNGWADIFAQYNKPEGIADTFIMYRGRSGKLRWRAKIHQYQSADHKLDVGKELNVELAYRASIKWELSAAFARYKPDSGFESLAESQVPRTTGFVSVKYQL
ncbi:hypothetical protein [Alteromonas oceanisediminis]|uniref:hypothetical protein n=1 Tax=Alteromonas oceanisediminis TaxID=2836180 RepID=UPI001BDA30DB|nr:hypothetical protein [Alteromonas oceanisediminis]MBT0586997.1 hypothetical protein [Alteromonas oceanisediminis]